MALSKIDGPLSVTGRSTPGQFDCPAGTLTDAAISALAAIDGTKLKHIHPAAYNDPSATTTATMTRQFYIVRRTPVCCSVFTPETSPLASAAPPSCSI